MARDLLDPLEGEATPRPEYHFDPAMTVHDRGEILVAEPEAPSIDGVYPSKAEQKAVWNAAWQILLRARKPVEVTALASVVASICPWQRATSVRAMLDKAARDGLLDRTRMESAGRMRTFVAIREGHRV